MSQFEEILENLNYDNDYFFDTVPSPKEDLTNTTIIDTSIEDNFPDSIMLDDSMDLTITDSNTIDFKYKANVPKQFIYGQDIPSIASFALSRTFLELDELNTLFPSVKKNDFLELKILIPVDNENNIFSSIFDLIIQSKHALIKDLFINYKSFTSIAYKYRNYVQLFSFSNDDPFMDNCEALLQSDQLIGPLTNLFSSISQRTPPFINYLKSIESDRQRAIDLDFREKLLEKKEEELDRKLALLNEKEQEKFF